MDKCKENISKIKSVYLGNGLIKTEFSLTKNEMTKIIKMIPDNDKTKVHALIERQWNMEQLKHLVRKLNIPNKKEVINKLKTEQTNG